MKKLLCFFSLAAFAGFLASAATVDLNGVARTLTSADDFTSATTYTNSGETVVDLTISVDEGDRITADAVIAGNIRLVKTGKGRLQLNAANTYAGGTLWQEGYLEANNTSAFGAAKTTVTCTTSSTGIHSGDLWFYLLVAGDYDYTFDFQNSNMVIWSIAPVHVERWRWGEGRTKGERGGLSDLLYQFTLSRVPDPHKRAVVLRCDPMNPTNYARCKIGGRFLLTVS